MHAFFEDTAPTADIMSYVIEVRLLAAPQSIIHSETFNITDVSQLTPVPVIRKTQFVLPLQDMMEPRSYEGDYQHRVRVYNQLNGAGTQIARSVYDFIRAPSADLNDVAPSLAATVPISVGTYGFSFTDSRPTGSDAYYKYFLYRELPTGPPAPFVILASMGHGLTGPVTMVHPPVMKTLPFTVIPGFQLAYTKPMRNYFKNNGVVIGFFQIGSKTANIYINGQP